MNCQKSILDKFQLRHFCLLIFALCLLISPALSQVRININSASREELMRLPFVGAKVAEKILEYRRKHGAFLHPQDLIVIKGLSAKRYKNIAHLIRVN
jgi:competence ComEA-like helix-hairpin-helix protein